MCYWKLENIATCTGSACHKVAKSLPELCSCSSVVWKLELASDEIRDLAEVTSKQSVKVVAWFLLTACSKMQEERNGQDGIVNWKVNRTQNLMIWKILSFFILKKMRNAVQER